jgi:hypothetical protein
MMIAADAAAARAVVMDINEPEPETPPAELIDS